MSFRSIKTESFFPSGLKLGAMAMIILGILIFVINPYASIIVFLLGIMIYFLHYGISLDLQKHLYKEYWGLLGLKFGKWQPMPKVEHLSVTKSKFSQDMGLRGASTTRIGIQYYGKLVIEQEEPILIISSESHKKVSKTIISLANDMQLRVVDNTDTTKQEMN